MVSCYHMHTQSVTGFYPLLNNNTQGFLTRLFLSFMLQDVKCIYPLRMSPSMYLFNFIEEREAHCLEL